MLQVTNLTRYRQNNHTISDVVSHLTKTFKNKGPATSHEYPVNASANLAKQTEIHGIDRMERRISSKIPVTVKHIDTVTIEYIDTSAIESEKIQTRKKKWTFKFVGISAEHYRCRWPRCAPLRPRMPSRYFFEVWNDEYGSCRIPTLANAFLR